VDGFYGFKWRLIVDDQGQWVSFFVTPGNVDERQRLRKMAQFIQVGDKGYISQALAEALWDKGVLGDPRKPVVWDDFDNLLLRKRSIIETIHVQLKNISQLEHARHRRLTGFMLKLLAALVAYSFQLKKPSLNHQARVVVDGDCCYSSMGWLYAYAELRLFSDPNNNDIQYAILCGYRIYTP
jgi:hypothetical protein